MRVALLGCGRIARVHAKQLRAHRKQVELAFASRDGERARTFARELGGVAYDGYDAAIADPQVAACVILTPPASHLPLALAALDAGKHVVLEKPPLLHAADFDQLERAAERAGRSVFVAENYRYKPSLAKIRTLIADGVVGDVLFVHVNAIRTQTDPEGDWRHQLGALYEGGIHWINFMASLGLTVRTVRGHRPDAASPERSIMVSFEYEEGAVGTLSHSWEVPTAAKGLRLSKIYGRRGSITFESNGLWVLCHGTKTRFSLPGLRDIRGHRAMWNDFVRAWTSGAPPLMTLADARRDLELVERAYATATEQPAADDPPRLEVPRPERPRLKESS